METAVLSEHFVRFRAFALNLRRREPHRSSWKPEFGGGPIAGLRMRQAYDFHLALLDALRRERLLKEFTHD